MKNMKHVWVAVVLVLVVVVAILNFPRAEAISRDGSLVGNYDLVWLEVGEGTIEGWYPSEFTSENVYIREGDVLPYAFDKLTGTLKPAGFTTITGAESTITKKVNFNPVGTSIEQEQPRYQTAAGLTACYVVDTETGRTWQINSAGIVKEVLSAR